MQTSRILIRPSGTLPGQEINWRIDSVGNGYNFFYSSSYMFNSYIYIIAGGQMNRKEKIDQLKKKKKYVELVLKELQDELYCLVYEERMEKIKQNEKY